MSKRGVLVFLLVLTLGTFGLRASGLPGRILAIRAILVKGGGRIPSDDILRLIDVRVGDNFFTLNAKELSARLQRHPWIRTARVERRYPNLVVRIQERRPFAQVAVPAGQLWCDEEGYVLNNIEFEPERAPLIQGLGSVESTEDGPRVGTQAQWRAVRQVWRGAPRGVSVSRLRFYPLWLDVYTPAHLVVRLPQEGLTAALQRWRAVWPVLQDLQGRQPARSVDLRFPGELIYDSSP